MNDAIECLCHFIVDENKRMIMISDFMLLTSGQDYAAVEITTLAERDI